MEKSSEGESGQIIAGYTTGTAPVDELNQELAAAWRSLIEDPLFLADAARMLNMSPEDLRVLDRPPFELGARHQGIGVVETAIVVFVGQIALEIGKDLAKDAAREGLRQLWAFVKTKMELKLPLGAFGRETNVEEGGHDPARTS